MKFNFTTRALIGLMTMGTAAVYYAQSTQDSIKETQIEEVVLTGVADIAKDRKTPVAISTIKEAKIIEKLGNQEFPELLNTTPSVYATKSGGGFGDAVIRVRGFDQVNTAVLINGVPINDMENGKVYWSNWAGLSDVTSAMQIQRGLGSSKLAIASVGGTINVLTRAADKKEGGTAMAGIGNNGYHKLLFAYNTGKSQSGWSSSFLMSRTAGSMYFDGSAFEGYNYYFALGFNPSPKHDLQFTITGAPQWHHQRYETSIKDFIKYGENGEPNRKYNSNWGYKGGEEFSMTRNYYHKPVMSLNWDWKISSATKLSSVFYASYGRGGGTGDAGSAWTGKFNSKDPKSPITTNIYSLPRTADGLIRFDDIVRYNQGENPFAGTVVDNSTPGGVAPRGILNPADGKTYTILEGFIRRSSINSHNWLGGIISLNHKFSDHLNLTVGVDGRTYRGYHYRVVSDFLGNTSYTETGNINMKPNVIKNAFEANPTWNPFGGANNDIKDQIIYSNDGIVKWIGGFGQLEYTNNNLSAFVQGSISNQNFQRIDYFLYSGEAQNSQKKSLMGFNIKGGANYNINEHHNIFFNAGYYERQPFFGAVFLNNRNDLNDGLTNEKVTSIEAGYGFRSQYLTANLNAYYTTWDDIYRRLTFRDANNNNFSANLLGLKQQHQGIELDFVAKPHRIVNINGMLSVGKYEFKGNPSAEFVNDQNQLVGKSTLYLDGIKVGDAAQFTAAIGADIKLADWVKIDGTYRYIDNLYSQFEPSSRTKADGPESLKLPSYDLFDLGIGFYEDITKKQKLVFRINVNNLFDKVYISESATNIAADTANPANNWNGVNINNRVNFGFGRTWNASVSFKF